MLYILQKNICFSVKIFFFGFANIADHDEMPYYAAFHLCQHYLSKYQIRRF